MRQCELCLRSVRQMRWIVSALVLSVWIGSVILEGMHPSLDRALVGAGSSGLVGIIVRSPFPATCAMCAGAAPMRPDHPKASSKDY